MSGELKADRRLYTNKDRTKLVEEGDPGAASLLAAEGRAIDPADVSALGLIVSDGRVVQGKAEPKVEKPKEAPKPEDKAQGKPMHKGVTKKDKK